MSTSFKANSGKAIFDAPYVEVHLNREESTLIYKWIGHIKDEDAMKGMNLITENIGKHSLKNMIADLSEFKGGSENTARWVNEVWSENLKAAGLQKLAVNVPANVFGDFSNKLALGTKAVSLLQVKKFTTYEDAFAWFRQNNPG